LPFNGRNRPPVDAQQETVEDGGTVTPVSRAAAIKDGYMTGARTLASRSVVSLARTRITPNALTAGGVTLCALASILVVFEDRIEILVF